MKKIIRAFDGFAAVTLVLVIALAAIAAVGTVVVMRYNAQVSTKSISR